MNECWPDDFRKAHEEWIKRYPPQEQNELRETREAWMRSERMSCCKDDETKR